MSSQPLEARVVPVRLCGYVPHCLLVDCSSWMNPLHLGRSMYSAPSTKAHCWNSKDLHNSSQCSTCSLPAKFTDCRQTKDFMDHLLHICHQGLDTNPRSAINLQYGIFWSSVNAIQLKRYGCRCPCCIFAALKMDTSEIVRIYGTPRVLVLSGSGYVENQTIDRPPCGDDIDHLTGHRACVCASNVVSHRRLLLSPSFTPSVHGNSPQPQISWSCCDCCSCVCVTSNHRNLSEPNSVQMYGAASDNTLPWNLCAHWAGKHTIACAHPRACGPSFLSPTKGSASVFHGARQTLFDNLFMGWNKKTTCARWDDRDLMFAQGERERWK